MADDLVNRRVRDRFVPLIVPLYIKMYVGVMRGERWIGYWVSVGLDVDDFW